MKTTEILLKINQLDDNHHTDSDDYDDGNQRQKETITRFSNENSMFIVFWTIFQKGVVIFIVNIKWNLVLVLKCVQNSHNSSENLLLIAEASATEVGIYKPILSSETTTLIIYNAEMEGILKIVKSLEDSSLLLKGVGKQFKMRQKNKKEDFLVCY